ncbi:DUF4382 domain-containing protein [Pelomonas aquatica]|jgi:hypothetical protein|uniref:DUF4382 domain-containing protein n=1 Tax=Pelomonas aquatica TaxID=431058 RepID=A0A9X4LIR0_9BURK|nr:DUF4382 domain-containing protein [Pelomonas aquatica]MCY4754500.1 DUF4382 domain-containing protein [Pelomonas aquatica]MDG0863674.1 DUF4382 domain-containing protein [Pelomonas aquatica]
MSQQAIHRSVARFGLPVIAAAALAACGGGGGYSGQPMASTTGTLRVSITDAPACGFDHVYVTVEKVRVNGSASAAPTDAGWTDITLATPQRIDLLALSNGALTTLGQTQLPAGSYQQLRLVLSANTPANPLANSVVPTGGAEQAVDTPSAAQSGIKLNAGMTVAADKVADFAIDFDACKSFVRAGNSGKIIMKPVLSLIPMLSDAGMRIVGFVDAGLANGGATVSVQSAGVPVRATPTDATGKFVLYPVPAGSYDLVVTANGRANAVVTGVPVTTTAYTYVGSDTVRLTPPASAASATVSGTVTLAGSTANTEGSVRALQALTGGPSVEVAFANADAASGAYSMRLPLAAPVLTPYMASPTSFTWTSTPADAAKYRFEALASGVTTPKTQSLTLSTDAVLNFGF